MSHNTILQRSWASTPNRDKRRTAPPHGTGELCEPGRASCTGTTPLLPTLVWTGESNNTATPSTSHSTPNVIIGAFLACSLFVIIPISNAATPSANTASPKGATTSRGQV